MIILDATDITARGSMAEAYRTATGKLPVNRKAVELVRLLREWMWQKGAQLATKERHGERGCFRAMFSYRVDAQRMEGEPGVEVVDYELQDDIKTAAAKDSQRFAPSRGP